MCVYKWLRRLELCEGVWGFGTVSMCEGVWGLSVSVCEGVGGWLRLRLEL